MITCVKGGPRRRIQRSLQSAEVLSGEMPSTKICLRTATAIRDVHNEILVKAKAAGELVPK